MIDHIYVCARACVCVCVCVCVCGQERLDFAMKEIIFDLLLVGKSYKTVFFPEVSATAS